MLDGPRWGPRSGKAEQLVVLCHGIGANGNDLIDIAPWLSAALPQAAFVAPDAPESYAPEPYAPELDAEAPAGRQWFPLWDRSPEQLPEGADAATVLLGAFIDAELRRVSLSHSALALFGFSQGAMMALHAGLRLSAPPHVILAFSGALLVPAHLPPVTPRPAILLVHGVEDEVVPAAQSRAAERVLREAGFQVEALYLRGVGHNIDETGLSAGALFLQKAFAT
jgi:phospholipase/carboxylesterase